ncbi:uncharacterized protein [Miscanthus floridulus]|uniref:uncharacterized protein n=1 Tax=Miscanthus floridulus TaxID=154761 RepID=UPI0034590A44
MPFFIQECYTPHATHRLTSPVCETGCNLSPSSILFSPRRSGAHFRARRPPTEGHGGAVLHGRGRQGPVRGPPSGGAGRDRTRSLSGGTGRAWTSSPEQRGRRPSPTTRAQGAIARGRQVKPRVKTSLAPGSGVVTKYLLLVIPIYSGLQEYLNQQGFHTVGYGCTTCIGNSSDLNESVSAVIIENDVVAAAILSGNRNFEGRVLAHLFLCLLWYHKKPGHRKW